MDLWSRCRVCDGKELTRCAPSRNSKGSIAFLADVEAAHPTGDIFVKISNLSSHTSTETRAWLAEHPRLHHVFLNAAQRGGGGSSDAMRLPGQSLANADEIEQATRIATTQRNHRANPWVWGRPPKTRWHLHRLLSYRL